MTIVSPDTATALPKSSPETPSDEDVSRSSPVVLGPDHDRVARDGYGKSERIEVRAVGREEMRRFNPDPIDVFEDVGRADEVRRRRVVVMAPDDHCVAVNGDAATEGVARAAVGGEEVGLLNDRALRRGRANQRQRYKEKRLRMSPLFMTTLQLIRGLHRPTD
jgi:hypothetical protein